MEKAFDFIAMEHGILHFWQDMRVFEQLKEQNKNGPPFRFLDGPITANNPMGIHHAWGRSLKDIFIRYKSMQGASCHYRNGFDTQGLWVEVEVEKKLGFTGKKDIEQYGLAPFTRRCVERIEKYAGIITKQSKRLGQWMDWENSYFTHTDENITAIWHFLKKCNDNGWLAQDYRPMPWCPRCGTSLSEHEMAGSHEELTHTSVFAVLPVKDRSFDILVWTTTPWTLAANAALAVNPSLAYVLVSVPGRARPLVLAQSALALAGSGAQALGTLPGSELIGLEYETFFPGLSVQQFTHLIVPWDAVAADEGSGVVHIAPGCGAEDFELGQSLGLPHPCPIDDNGVFTGEYGFLAGRFVSDASSVIFACLEQNGKLFRTLEYTHAYPVCWRCKHEVLFRLVRTWVIRTNEIRPKLIEAARSVHWEPVHIGKRMEDWLLNMGDWNISRKRFYGLPLPFYSCEKCGHLTVIGSKEELRTLGGAAVDTLPELHRPWIDEITIHCPHCGAAVSRVPDVGDVWLDAGITPFSTLGYFKNREEWSRQFPIEWVTEMHEQVRLWFYSLLFMSVTLTGTAPYQRVLAYSSVVSETGARFSKTGYMIRFDEAAEVLGADAIRYLFAGAGLNGDVRFSFSLGEKAHRKILNFRNIISFYQTYAQFAPPMMHNSYNPLPVDRWLESRLSQFISESTAGYDGYHSQEVIKAFEAFIDDVSNWYVRTNRRRFWSGDTEAFSVLYQAIKTSLQIMAPVLPFLSEYVWQTLVRKKEPKEALSVHLSGFPCVGTVSATALAQMRIVRSVAALALKLRNDGRVMVKQPLQTLYVVCGADEKAALVLHEQLLLREINVKCLLFADRPDALQTASVTLNYRTAGSVLKDKTNTVKNILAGLSEAEMADTAAKILHDEPVMLKNYPYPMDAALFLIEQKPRVGLLCVQEGGLLIALDTRLTPELVQEGRYRELLRLCQVMRKESGFRVDEKIVLALSTVNAETADMIRRFAEPLRNETLSVRLFDKPCGLRHKKILRIGGVSVEAEMEAAPPVTEQANAAPI